MSTGVYLIAHGKGKAVYVGSAALSFKERWRAHRYRLRRGKHHNIHLQAAWDKHGEEAFGFEVVEECPPEECLVAEQRWIDSLRARGMSLYNQCLVAGSPLGVKRSEEFGLRMSLSNRMRKGEKRSEEARRNISLSLKGVAKGRKASEETRRKMSLAHKGKRLSEENKKNISLAKTGKKQSQEWIRNVVEAKRINKLLRAQLKGI